MLRKSWYILILVLYKESATALSDNTLKKVVEVIFYSKEHKIRTVSYSMAHAHNNL